MTLPSHFFQDELSSTNRRTSSASRCNKETDLARVLFGIVITFILCHALRILLSFQEAIVIKNVMACTSAGKPIFPRWAVITNQFSELILVLNSSVNLIIYCCFNKAFRQHMLSCKNHFFSKLGWSSAVPDDTHFEMHTFTRQLTTDSTREIGERSIV